LGSFLRTFSYEFFLLRTVCNVNEKQQNVLIKKLKGLYEKTSGDFDCFECDTDESGSSG